MQRATLRRLPPNEIIFREFSFDIFVRCCSFASLYFDAMPYSFPATRRSGATTSTVRSGARAHAIFAGAQLSDVIFARASMPDHDTPDTLLRADAAQHRRPILTQTVVCRYYFTIFTARYSDASARQWR